MKRRTKRIITQEATRKIDTDSIVNKLKVVFQSESDPLLRSDLDWSVRKFTMFTDKEFPLKAYRDGLRFYIENKKKEIKFLKKHEKFRYILFPNADEILEEAEKQLSRAKIMLKEIQKMPVEKGRPEEFFLNTYIEELLVIRVNHGLSIKNSYDPEKGIPYGECLEWIHNALRVSGYEPQSKNAIDRRIDRIIRKNKYLKSQVNS